MVDRGQPDLFVSRDAAGARLMPHRRTAGSLYTVAPSPGAPDRLAPKIGQPALEPSPRIPNNSDEYPALAVSSRFKRWI
jgi:hypothetical protein